MAGKSTIDRGARAAVAAARAPRGAFAGAALAALALLLSPAPAALAAPSHPPLADPIGGFPLNHACGTAVDSEGDIYVSNAGEAKVEVFDPTGSHLQSIADANEPCGLAVDSKGNLYLSEQATGKVLRYTPNAYPFSGTPSYGAPTTIDASGNAKGIAVDPTDDRLYVAEGNRVSTFAANGNLGIDESQRVRIELASGTFTLTFEEQTTAPIPFNASHAEVQAALEALSSIGAGNVSVTQSPDDPGNPKGHLITFTSALASKDVEQLTGSASCCSIQTKIQGWGGRIAEGELSGATGVAPYSYSPFEHYLSAAEPSQGKIEVLHSSFGISELEPRASIDGSETPAGELGLAATGADLGVDPTNGHLFAYDAIHKVLDEFEANGHYFTQIADPAFEDAEPTAVAIYPQWDEVQSVVRDATSGTFTLSFEGQETGALQFNEPAAKVREALESLSSVGAGHVIVSGGEGGTGELRPYRVSFVGALGDRDVPQLLIDGSGLAGDNLTVPGTGPNATVTTIEEGRGPGRLYVSAGASAGARLLAFGPEQAPSRLPLPEPPSEKFIAACGTVVDSQGDLYVAGEAAIKIYAPEPGLKAGKPQPLAEIKDPNHPCDLAVDSEGNLYAAERGPNYAVPSDDESVALFKPSAYPFSGTPTYTEKPPIETLGGPEGIAVNPADDHLFTVHEPDSGGVHEYDSAANGSALLETEFCGLFGELNGIDVYGANGDVYVVGSSTISVCNASGSKVLGRIDGSGSPAGLFSGELQGVRIAVDQTNGHVLVGEMKTARGVVEEYEASGAFVARFGSFASVFAPSDIALDSSGGPNQGNLYVAFLNDLSAFGPLKYGEPPIALSGIASEVGGGEATLGGTINPRGFELTECRFEYLTDAAYEANLKAAKPPFEGAQSKACAESLEEIGNGSKAVAVHAHLAGLDPEGRYRFRLVAENAYGTSEGEAGLFGAPLISAKSAQPVLYHEATLRARLDPSGLDTSYRFEYLTAAHYEANGESFTDAQSTPTKTLPAGAGPTDIEAPLTGLAEGTSYRFRLIAENETASAEGPAQELRTLSPRPTLECPNEALRLENTSAYLPDCRAYELVTPADTRGARPRGVELESFNEWLVTPSGPLAGESLAYFLGTTLPGTEGNGLTDGLRATRGGEGWSSELFGPTFAQNGYGGANPHGIAPDQLYSLWVLGDNSQPDALPEGIYLRTPDGFEAVGIGSLGTDLKAEGKYISPGGGHVIFESRVRLEPAAPESPPPPEAPLAAIYDRSPGGPTHVVSLLPGEVTPSSPATFMGATPDGTSVAFSLGGKLYLRRNNAETLEVTNTPASFAGLSDDGSRLFYTGSGDPQAIAALYAFDLESQNATEIASNARFVDVSADGTRAYFTEGGNLYLWDGSGTTFVATLATKDLQVGAPPRFPGTFEGGGVALDAWTAECAVKRSPMFFDGRANCPSRTTPDGRFLVFQSHADLTPPYEGNGHSEIYHYDAAEGSLLCVSCDPSGAPATAEADLQTYGIGTPVQQATLIPGISDDGGEVIFQAEAQLLPEDANSVLDVYEWQAQGAGGCTREAGCLTLISSGQGDTPSYIYSMTPNGHDVFFTTTEKLIPSDITGSPSIYDARVEGGFPVEVEREPCHGDACQGEGSTAPSRPTTTTHLPDSGNYQVPPKPRCHKGQRRVRRAGKVRCVKAHHTHRHKHRHRQVKRDGGAR